MDLDKRILYRTFGLSSTCSQEDVELAYRRFMMCHHPGDEETAVDPSKDPAVVAAVARKALCDPEVCKKYNNSFGLLMPETGSETGNGPDCVTFTLFAIFLSVLAIRVYGILDWNYYVVFIPLWVMNSWLICVQCLTFYLEVRLAVDQQDKILSRFIKELFNITLIIAFQTLVARKANDPSSTSAWLVFAPYFVVERWSLLSHLAAVIEQYFSGGSLLPFAGQITFITIKLWSHIIKLSLAILVMLRIDNVITCSWGVVFIPLYIVVPKDVLKVTLWTVLFSYAHLLGTRSPLMILVISLGIVSMLTVTLDFPPVIALVKILDGNSDTASYMLFLVIISCLLALFSTRCCLYLLCGSFFLLCKVYRVYSSLNYDKLS